MPIKDRESGLRHPVRLVASWTGLSPHVLRAWERRYSVVSPVRSEGGQRLYSDRDVERLRTLHRLTERGHSISHLARLSGEELAILVLQEKPTTTPPPLTQAVTLSPEDTEDYVRAALEAVGHMDAVELQAILERAAVGLGVPAFLEKVASPVIHNIGDEWINGRLGSAHERLATAVLRRVLGWVVGLLAANTFMTASLRTRRLIVATPSRQVHELGAMLVAAAAAAEGWDVTYLGADLPVAEIANAAHQTRAQIVALNVVHPSDDPLLPDELARLRIELPDTTALLLGGRGAAVYAARRNTPNLEIIDSLGALRSRLRIAVGPSRAAEPEQDQMRITVRGITHRESRFS